jgi:hypothetical protein
MNPIAPAAPKRDAFRPSFQEAIFDKCVGQFALAGRFYFILLKFKAAGR